MELPLVAFPNVAFGAKGAVAVRDSKNRERRKNRKKGGGGIKYEFICK